MHRVDCWSNWKKWRHDRIICGDISLLIKNVKVFAFLCTHITLYTEAALQLLCLNVLSEKVVIFSVKKQLNSDSLNHIAIITTWIILFVAFCDNNSPLLLSPILQPFQTEIFYARWYYKLIRLIVHFSIISFALHRVAICSLLSSPNRTKWNIQSIFWHALDRYSHTRQSYY